MLLLPAAIGAYLLVNAVCAFFALTFGFAAGVLFLTARRAKPPEAPASAPQAAKQQQLANERAAMASGRLVDLAKSMASDVSDHAAKVTAITKGLRTLDGKTRADGGLDSAVYSALDQIVSANAELQQRLLQAERQIEAQAAEIRTHESEARTDSLTGLANRRAFDDEMRRRIAEWDRNRSPFTLILLDIDHFKTFNDVHGHQAGDEVLRQVAGVLQGQSREMDLPCRYGGEEFAVILPCTESEGACLVAERIRQAIQASLTMFEARALRVTASLGLAEVRLNDDAARVIKRADEGLYKSKEAGRNCGHWHDGEQCRPITEPPSSARATKQSPARVPVETQTTSRTTFLQVLKRRVTESHRFGIPLCVMHLRIDEYRALCRLYGPDIGQFVLDTALHTFRKALRDADVVAPLEKDEFLFMLPSYTLGEAGLLVKRLRIALANSPIPQAEREVHLHFRHSIAELKAGETAQELIARARRGAAHWPHAGQELGV